MLKFKLINNIVLSDKSTLIGDREIDNRHILPLSHLMGDVKGYKYLGLYKVEISLLSKVLPQYDSESSVTVVLQFPKGYNGVVINSMLIVVDPETLSFAYKNMLNDGQPKGTLNLTEEDLKYVKEKINNELSVNFREVTIQRVGDTVNLYYPQGSSNLVFSGKFEDLIFSKTGDLWTVGLLQVDDKAKDGIIKYVNQLFNYKEPVTSKVAVDCCCYSNGDSPINELFGNVREANKIFNADVSANKKDVRKQFWETFNSKLELLAARGYDIADIVSYYGTYVEECKERNQTKIS